MSSRWLRDLPCRSFTFLNAHGSLILYMPKAVAQFLHKVMDYTFQSTNCPAGRDFLSYESNGVNGAFGGSSWVLTDATAASFAQSDVGKLIAIKDNTNPRNGGVYFVTKYISATQIEIDYRADPNAGEYPTASTGLSWWIWDRNYELPTNGDYVRLQSRHASGWAIELNHVNTGYNSYWTRLWVKVAVDGNWAGGKIITKGNYSLSVGPGYTNIHAFNVFVEGDYDGEWLHIWGRMSDSNEAEYNTTGGIAIARITELESGHDTEELLVVCGTTSTSFDASAAFGFQRDNANNVIGNVMSWSNRINGVLQGRMLESTYANAIYGLTRDPTRQLNRRTGKTPLIPGTLVLMDVNNDYNCYHILGRMKGHYTTKWFAGGGGRNGNMYRWHVPLTKTTSKDLFMIADGFVIAWPGVTCLI